MICFFFVYNETKKYLGQPVTNEFNPCYTPLLWSKVDSDLRLGNATYRPASRRFLSRLYPLVLYHHHRQNVQNQKLPIVLSFLVILASRRPRDIILGVEFNFLSTSQHYTVNNAFFLLRTPS